MIEQPNFAQEGTPLVIVGTDADARLALDIANAQDVIVYGFMSDNEEDMLKDLNDVSVVMRVDTPDGKKFLDNERPDMIVADRDIARRKDLLRKVNQRKAKQVNLAHPDVIISPYTKIGIGNLFGPQTVIFSNSQIGNHNSFQGQILIDSDTLIADFCTIQSGVKIGRNVTIEEDVFVGMGAIIFAGVKVGKGAYIAPGAVVLQSVKEKDKMVGNPAKPI